jgi:hypothetical protein
MTLSLIILFFADFSESPTAPYKFEIINEKKALPTPIQKIAYNFSQSVYGGTSPKPTVVKVYKAQ